MYAGVKNKKQLSKKQFCLLYGAIALLFLLTDQAVKLLVQQNMQPSQSYPLWRGVVQLTYVQNTGIAFGAFAGKTFVIIAVSAVLMAVLVGFLLRKESHSHMVWLSVSAIAAGGIGNMADRVRLHYVVDFIDLQFMQFPVFNIADMWVVGGTILLLIYIVFFEEKQGGKEKNLH